MPGLIAIVGRPNVGKSALFNRIAGRRIAIVHDQPGVTRDRITAEAEWNGHPFTLVDTGGIGLLRGEHERDVILKAAIDQVTIAIEAANVLIFVVNVQEGVVPLDREVAQRLRRSGKPVLVAVNKVDTDRAEPGSAEFAALGFDRLFSVSAIHGGGVDDLVEAALSLLPRPAANEQTQDEETTRRRDSELGLLEQRAHLLRSLEGLAIAFRMGADKAVPLLEQYREAVRLRDFYETALKNALRQLADNKSDLWSVIDDLDDGKPTPRIKGILNRLQRIHDELTPRTKLAEKNEESHGS